LRKFIILDFNTLNHIKIISCEDGEFILTDTIKKSWCKIETIPKLVNLNSRSIIHIKLGRTFGLALNDVIKIGTSPVLWWFAITNVFSFMIFCISSPCSITIKQKNIFRFKSDQWIYFIYTYCRNLRTKSTSIPLPTTNEKIGLRFANIPEVDILLLGTIASSTSRMWVCNRHCLLSQILSEWHILVKLIHSWLSYKMHSD